LRRRFPHTSRTGNPSIIESTQFPSPNKQTQKKNERQHNTQTPRNNWLKSLIRMKRGPNPGARETPRGGGTQGRKKWPEKKNRTSAWAGGAQLAGSASDSASRGEGSRSNRRFGRRDAAAPLSLSRSGQGGEEIAVARDKRGKEAGWSSRPNGFGWLPPARPDPRGDARGERPCCATDRSWRRRAAKASGGRGSPAAGGAPSWRRVMDAASGGGSGAKARCVVWPVATDRVDDV